MAKTDPNAPRHKQYSTFIVELPNPGYKIKRNIANMSSEPPSGAGATRCTWSCMALVVARTDPNAPRHKQHSTFIVELPNPGYKIKRNVANMTIR